MLGLFPPSSIVTRLFVAAAICITWRPTSVEPVNEILSTSGWRASAAPAVDPPPGTTLNAPGGKPASRAISAKRGSAGGRARAAPPAGARPAARHDVERTRRKTRLQRNLGEEQGGERRFGGGLQHHRAAGRQRRRELPADR